MIMAGFGGEKPLVADMMSVVEKAGASKGGRGGGLGRPLCHYPRRRILHLDASSSP